jgi:hypothetical protein
VVEVAEAAEANKTCFNCGKKNHPSSSCMKAAVANDDDSTSIVQSIKKLAKDTKNLKKAFTQLQKTNKQDFDFSGSESEVGFALSVW